MCLQCLPYLAYFLHINAPKCTGDILLGALHIYAYFNIFKHKNICAYKHIFMHILKMHLMHVEFCIFVYVLCIFMLNYAYGMFAYMCIFFCIFQHIWAYYAHILDICYLHICTIPGISCIFGSNWYCILLHISCIFLHFLICI